MGELNFLGRVVSLPSALERFDWLVDILIGLGGFVRKLGRGVLSSLL